MNEQQKRTEENKRLMLEALSKSLGIVSTAAKKAGINRETHRLWCQSDLEYAQRVAEIREEKVDFMESMLHKRCAEGDTTAIIFGLKTQGKDRGYVEKQHIEVTTNLTEEERKSRIAELKAKLEADGTNQG